MAYNEETGEQKGKFLISNIVAGIKSEQKVGEIKFKVKEGAKEGTTVIKFKNITSNDGGNLVTESDKSVVIKIKEKNTTNKPNTNIPAINNTPDTNNVPNTNNTPNTSKPNTNIGGGINNSGNSTTIQNGTSNNTVKDVSQNNMPYTGANDIIKVAIVLIGIIAMVTYIKYKEIKIK